MKPALRQRLLSLHVFVGCTVGVLLVAMAITGAALAWRPQIEPVVNRTLFVVEPTGVRLSCDDLVARARAAHPGSELDYVRYFSDPTAPVLVRFTNKDFVHLNPYTGAVLGQRNRYGHFFGWMEGFHRFLFLDQRIGEPIVGSAALGFAFMILSGVALWWPATVRTLKASLTLNRARSGRASTLKLHKTLGAYAAAIVLVTALTGPPQALDWVKRALYVVTRSQPVPAPKGAAKGETPFLGMEAIVRRVQEFVPGARETLIHFPENGLVEAFSIAVDAPHPNARTYVWLEAPTAKVVRFTPYAHQPAGYQLAFWALSIHMGQVGGWPARLLLFSGALCVPLLAATGIAGYLRRKSRASAPAAARMPIPEPASVK